MGYCRNKLLTSDRSAEECEMKRFLKAFAKNRPEEEEEKKKK